jgi:fatty-acyl-CoA synthase
MTWQPHTLADTLRRNAASRPDAMALITPTARLTWGELHAGARRFAKGLIASDVRRGDFVGLMCANDERWIDAFYGAALIGAVTVPVNTRFKATELAYCLRQSDVKLFVTMDRFLNIGFTALLREAEPAIDRALPGTELPLLSQVVVLGDDVPAAALGARAFMARADSVEDAQLDAAVAAVDPSDLLLIQFTSGTTAFPKGVMLSHENMLHNAAAAGSRLGIGAEDNYFNCRPFFHVAGSTLSLLTALEAGACLSTLPTFDAGQALEMLMRERCTFISGNDTLFQLMLAHPTFDRSRLHLRGGWAAAGPETMRKIVDNMGIPGICWAYGQSEASPNVAMSDVRDPLELRVNGMAPPLPGVELRIVGDDGCSAVAQGQTGEIQVRGWNVMRGYYRQPELSAKAIGADGWLRTGDLGSMTSDGRLCFVGRLKDLFRVGGENVAPAEVEEALLAHPAIANVQVVGVPDPRLGEVPAAYVTLRPGQTLTPEELLAWCKPRMANFRAPRYVQVVQDFERIGMTASGKVQKNKLREHAIAAFGLANKGDAR